MTTPNQHPQVGKSLPGQAQRAPIEQEVELKFPNFELLVTAMSANISTSGMFIQTLEPPPVGTTLSFRFRIEDWSPIQGTARVIWNRDRDEAPDRPAGMGVSFVDADAQSRRMIRYLVDKHLEAGGEPFELGHQPELSPDLETARAQASPDSPAARRQTTRLLWAVGAALMVGVVALGLWFQMTRPPVDEGRPPPTMVEGGQTGTAGPAEVSPPDEPSGNSAAPGDRLAEEAIRQLVQDWSAAWEGGQVDELLAFYSPDFEPAGRETRAQWETRVRREISNASFTRVAISALEISAPTASEGQASFFQSIRSDQRNETLRTSLEVARSDDGWKIIRQSSSR